MADRPKGVIMRLMAIPLSLAISLFLWQSCCGQEADFDGGMGTLYDARFSSNGDVFAFKRSVFEYGVLGGRKIRAVEFCWGKGPAYRPLRSVRVRSTRVKETAGPSPSLEYAFSPDSKYIFIDSQDLILIEVESGETKRLSKTCLGAVTIRWVSENTLLYITHDPVSADDYVPGGMYVYKGLIDGGKFQTRLVAKLADAHNSKVSWSPDSRFVLISPSHYEKWRLLDTKSGIVREFGDHSPIGAAISWRKDGELVACISRESSGADPRALLFNTSNSTVIDFSKDLIASVDKARIRADGPESNWYDMSEIWTTDGRHIVFESLCCLISPSPFERVEIATCVRSLDGFHKDVKIWQCYRLRANGWLLIEIEPKTDNEFDFPLIAVSDDFRREWKVPNRDIADCDRLTDHNTGEMISPSGKHYFYTDRKSRRVNVAGISPPLETARSR